jgi:hypothetical protein
MASPILAQAIEHWNDLLGEDAEAHDRLEVLRKWLTDRELAVEGRPLCTVLRPHLVVERDLDRQAGISERLISAVYKIRDALLGNEGLRRKHLGKFEEAVGGLLELEKRPVADGALIRLDSSLARTQLHFIELNADTPQGTGHNDGVVDFFQRLETFQRFSERYRARPLRLEGELLDTLVAAWHEWGGAGKPSIATICWGDDPVRITGLEIDHRYFQRQGIESVLCDPRELTFDGTRLRHGDLAIDVVHRVLLTGECLERTDDLEPVMEAVRAGAVCMVNPFRSELLGHKAVFALLTDPRHDFGFTSEERAAIRAHVPWTRQVVDAKVTAPGGEEVDLADYAMANRSRLVLKPAHDYGGHGVHLGWQESEPEWSSSLERSMEADYIVQHRVELHHEEYPTLAGSGSSELYYEDTDPFIFRGRLGGVLTRLSASEITNVHASGSLVASFAIEPRA